jgi:hypothetical protein
VEFSNDELTDDCRLSIKMIISGQSNKRDTQCWMNSLRGSNPDVSPVKGMIKLNLSKNTFGDLFADTISEAIKNDSFIKVRFLGSALI